MTLAVMERPAIAAERSVTAKMLRAGRAAFLRERRNLSDLYECFDEDRDQFLSAIYRSMEAAR